MKPRSIVFDLFGDHLRYCGGSVRTQVLVDLLDVFDIGEPTARIALNRMRKDGWLDTRREGRHVVWALTAKGWRLLDEGRGRIFDRTRTPWDGLWRMVIYAVPESDRAVRERLRRTLAWWGFGPLAASTWISPHDRLDAVEQALAEVGAVRADLFTCRSRGPSADADMVARCWNLEDLRAEYDGFVQRLDELPHDSDLARLSGREALRRQIELVAHYRRFPFQDPDLPAELLPPDWPGVLAHDRFVATHEALDPAARNLVLHLLSGGGRQLAEDPPEPGSIAG